MALLKKKMDVMYPKFLANGSTSRLFFQCCTIVVTNPTLKFGIKHSCDSREPKHSHFQDLQGCTFYECHSRVFVLSNRIKTDFGNRLSRPRLDTCLCVREEGPNIKYFKSDCVIDCWWAETEKHLEAFSHNYTAKKYHLNSAEHFDLPTLTMSDLEN